MLERSNVEWPMWRKKVDRSLLHYGITPLPGWVCNMWSIESDFGDVYSKVDSRSDVTLHAGKVGVAQQGKGKVYRLRTPATQFRLEVDSEARQWLRREFIMSYMRAIEIQLRGGRDVEREVEANPSFWEFIDIEYDRLTRTFKLVAHYRQTVLFPATMQRMMDESLLERLMPTNDMPADSVT